MSVTSFIIPPRRWHPRNSWVCGWECCPQSQTPAFAALAALEGRKRPMRVSLGGTELFNRLLQPLPNKQTLSSWKAKLQLPQEDLILWCFYPHWNKKVSIRSCNFDGKKRSKTPVRALYFRGESMTMRGRGFHRLKKLRGVESFPKYSVWGKISPPSDNFAQTAFRWGGTKMNSNFLCEGTVP